MLIAEYFRMSWLAFFFVNIDPLSEYAVMILLFTVVYFGEAALWELFISFPISERSVTHISHSSVDFG